MESDDVEKRAGGEQDEESGARSATESTSASPRRSGVVSPVSTGQSSPVTGLTGLEQQRRVRLHPAASAVHLVPDIVVEHVSSATFSDIGTSRQPVPCRGLSPTLPDVLEARLAAGRQFRALSDSSVDQLERFQHCSAVALSPDIRRRATCLVHSAESLDQFPSTGMVKFSGSDPSPPELEMEVFGSECTSQETSGSPSRQYVQQLSPDPVMWPVGSPYWQPSLPTMQSLGPERSPKANWLRRHSDSNLTTGHGLQVGLRVEPYPIRSHSTGDTLLNVASSREQPVSSAAKDSLHRVLKEPIPDSGHSEQQRTTVPSHLWSTAGRLWQERASPTVRKVLSEGARQSVTHMEDWRLSERSCPESMLSREFLSESEKTGSVEREKSGHLAGTTTAVSAEQTEVINMSTRERDVASERSEGLVEKRMKLKKYLQTRYQMSQHRLHQSSDTDDVFMERVCTADRSASSAASATELSEPKDLSARSHALRTTESVYGDIKRSRELDSGSIRQFSVSSSLQEPSEPRTFPPAIDRSQFPRSADNMPLLVKHEPTSPGIVPSGASVFVFPPTVPSHHEPTEWYQPIRHHSSSPVPSPLSSGTSESYNPVVLFPRFFRQPSYPGEEVPYRAAGLRIGHHYVTPSMTDVSAIYRRRARSLAISTEISPLTLSEAMPSSPRYRRTVAGSEMMPISPASRLSPAESFPHRLRTSSQWQHHHMRGRQSSSSIDDPANFICPMCSVVFPSYRHLTDHMVDHVGASSPPPPLEPGEHSEAESASSEVSGGPKAVHLCPICQRSFSRGDMLTRHVRLHTGIRPYECTLCSQVSKCLVSVTVLHHTFYFLLNA